MSRDKVDASEIIDYKNDGGILNSDIMKALEDIDYDLAQLLYSHTVEIPKNINNRLNYHMIVKKTQIGYFHKLLPNGHLSNRTAADYKY